MKYSVIITWRADDVSVGTKIGVKFEKQSTTYDVVFHEFHPNNWFSITYENGTVEYFNRDSIFSIKAPKPNSPPVAAVK